MSYTTHHSDRAIPSSRAVSEAALAIVSRVGGALQRAIAEYRTRHALMKLDDLMLKDIGLSRSDIEAAARGVRRD